MQKIAALLQSQIDKLNEKDFDLNTWKTTTVLILQRVFGSTDPKIREIEQLHLDYSSWTLRDASGEGSAIDRAKAKGKDILELALSELDIFGVSEDLVTNAISSGEMQGVIDIFEDELKVSHLREIREILESSLIESDKTKKLSDALKNFGPNVSALIVARILLQQKDEFLQ